MAADDKPWLVDGGTGQVTTYGEVLGWLSASSLRLRALCRPDTVHDALLEIAKAVAHDAPLTLLDSDFGEQEIRNLGYEPAQLNQSAAWPVPKVISRLELARQAGGASRARIGLFTSGSTGLPKLVWQSAANLARAVRVSDRQAQAVWALAYNPTHVAGIQVYLQALANGCPVVNVYGLDRSAVLAAIKRHGVTHLSATPSFYRLLLPVDQPLTGVQSISLGGEVADSDLLARLRAAFPHARLHNVYASTEAGTLLVAEDDVFRIPEQLADRIKLHEDRLWVHRSLLGEFGGAEGNRDTVSGETVANREAVRQSCGEAEANDEAVKRSDGLTDPRSHGLTATADAAAWYDTGDVVEVVSAEPLRFRIIARARDWVNVGGSKVNPQEVESVIASHQGVKQVRVFGQKNSVMGSILCAEVVAAAANREAVANRDAVRQSSGEAVASREAVKQSDGVPESQSHSVTGPQSHGLTESALRAWLGARLQPHKVPRIIRFVDKLAVTRSGKVLRQ